MTRFLFTIVASTLLLGCSMGNRTDRAAERAAFAASATYPQQQPSTDLPALALIDRDDGTIRILNPTDQAIRDANVWVNGNFVARVDSIPPHGGVTLRREVFYNPAGRSLSDLTTPATTVQLDSSGNFLHPSRPGIRVGASQTRGT